MRAVGIVAIGAIAFMLVLSVTVANVFRNARPAVALKWAPADAAAAANLAALALGGDSSADAGRTVRDVAIAAFRRDPTTVVAIRVLGLSADAAGDQAAALQLLTAAERVSRRDQATEAWFIMHHFGRGDAQRTMHHFDIALRTTNRRLDMLLPLLVRVSADRRMLPSVRRLLDNRPRWAVDFASHLVRTGQPLSHVVFLTHGMLDSSDPGQAYLIQLLIARLVEAGEFDRAWSVYQEQRPGSGSPADLRNAGFEASGNLAPFDWELVDELGLVATLERRPDTGNALFLSASDDRTGEVARQLVRLPAGAYRLQLETANIPRESAQRPRIGVRCAGTGGATLLSVRTPAVDQVPRRATARFAVPAGCRWQWLSFEASNPGGAVEASPWVDNIVIAPIS